MADPDSIIQKVLQKLDYFDLEMAIPNVPSRLQDEYNTLRSESDKVIFRKLWEKATNQEKKKIESDINYEKSRSRSPSHSPSRSRSSYSDSISSISSISSNGTDIASSDDDTDDD